MGHTKQPAQFFRELFSKVVEMTPHFLYNDEKLFATDIGPTIITATFDDKHRETVNYFSPSKFFEEYFRVIKQMVPGCEYTPVVLLTDEDFEDEEE